MSKIRQYIGARYVLKIYENSQNPLSADWESGTHYDPLIMVTYQNSSYVSKKEVPSTVGNPPANPEYWTVTGAYNGQIAQLQRDVQNLQQLVDLIDTGYVDNRDRNILFITDSYGVFLNPVTQNFPYLVLDMLECDGDVIAEGGSGFIGNGTANTFLQLFNSAEVKAYTDVVFAGGYNDKDTPATTIASTVEAALEAVANVYDNVNIWVICCGASSDSDVNFKLLAAAKGYSDGCTLPNAYFANLSTVLLKRDLLAMDGVHPGSNGMEALAVACAQALKRSYDGAIQTLISTGVTDRNGTSRGGVVISAMNNGVPIMKIKSFQTTLNTEISGITCDGNDSHAIKICDLQNPLLQGGQFNSVNAMLYVQGKQTEGGNNVFWNIPGWYKVYDGELRFVPMRTAEGYSAWFSLYSAMWIATPDLTFVLPAYAE